MRKSPKLRLIIAAVVGLCILVLLKSFIHVGARTGTFEDDKRFATGVVDRFHARFGAGQYEAIYDQATRTFNSGQ
jgi:hypothetical protein